jgi:hypothetical protein
MRPCKRCSRRGKAEECVASALATISSAASNVEPDEDIPVALPAKIEAEIDFGDVWDSFMRMNPVSDERVYHLVVNESFRWYVFFSFDAG